MEFTSKYSVAAVEERACTAYFRSSEAAQEAIRDACRIAVEAATAELGHYVRSEAPWDADEGPELAILGKVDAIRARWGIK